MEPRGVRLRNPLNLKRTQDEWEGLSLTQPDPVFCCFDDPVYGLRAAAICLLRHQDRGCDTVEKHIEAWTDPEADDVEAYVAAVQADTGLFGTVDLRDPDQMEQVMKAMCRHENGEQPYPNEVYEKAIALAEER